MPQGRLYAILDADACAVRGLSLVAVGEGLCRAAPGLLQFRAKGLPAREVLEVLARLRAWTQVQGTQLYMNDRADLAALAGCDGVHVGQMDQPVASVRRHFPGLRVGVSTHSEEEFERALGERPDYVALGPIFSTSSKRAAEPTLGLSELARLAPRARALAVPLVAIGGIDQDRAPLVAAHAEHAAVIAALLPPEAGARELAPASLVDAVCRRTQAYAAALGG